MSVDAPLRAYDALNGASLAEVREVLESAQQNHGVTPFEGAGDVALVRLDEYRNIEAVDRSSMTFRYTYTGLTKLFESDIQFPDSILFYLQRGCAPFAGPGDSLLVPLPTWFSGGELFVVACSRQWKLERGYVAGLGVSLADVTRKLSLVGGSVRLKRVGMNE